MIWLYITAIATAIIAMAGWLVNKDAMLWLKIVIICLVVVIVITQVIIINAQQKEKELSRYAGILEGKSVTVLSVAQQVYPKLRVGNSNTYLNWQGQEDEPMIKMSDATDLTIWVEDGKLKVSTKIINSKGELIAEISGNEWKVKQSNAWDRNFNKNALEVKDEMGNVVLQVVLQKDYIQFSAKMHDRTGQGFAIGSSKFTQEDILKHEQGELKIVAASDGPQEVEVGDITGVFEIRPPGKPLELVIEPIFEYPSELHLGELK